MPSERSISQTHCSPPRNNLRILMRCRPTRTDTNFACSSHAEFQSVPMFRTSQSGERSSMSQLPLIQCTLIYYTKTFECQNQPLSLINISEPTRLGMISYAVFCLK